MTNETTNDITFQDFEIITQWVEQTDTDSVSLIVLLLTTNPIPYLSSKYEDFEIKVIDLIKRFGFPTKSVRFNERVVAEDVVRMSFGADETDDEIREQIIERDYGDFDFGSAQPEVEQDDIYIEDGGLRLGLESVPTDSSPIFEDMKQKYEYLMGPIA